MGSGLLFGGIGVLWITVLSRTWLNRRSLARADRDAPPSSRQRILDPGGRGRGRRGGRVRSAAHPGPAREGAARLSRVSGGLAGGTANRSVVAVQTGVPGPSRAVRRRRRVLFVLVVVAAAAVAAVLVHRAPWWSAAAAAGLATGWSVLATVAARAGRRSRRSHRRRLRIREQAVANRRSRRLPGPVPADAAASIGAPIEVDGEPPWACVPRVGVVARWGREEYPTDGLDRRLLVASLAGAAPAGPGATPGATPDGVAGAVLRPGPGPDPHPAGLTVTPAGPDGPSGVGPRHLEHAVGLVDSSWQPVPVPLPTYVTAPRAPRTVASIDLGCPGAWTAAAAGVGSQTAQILLGWGAVPDPRPQIEVVRPQVQVDGSAADRTAGEPDAAPGPDVVPAAGPPAVAAPDRPTHQAGAGSEDELTTEVTYELPRAVGT